MFVDQGVFHQDITAQPVFVDTALAQMTEIEDRLAGIIYGAREMAAVAEEMMRNLSTTDMQGTTHDRRAMHVRVNAGKQLIGATRHQLGALMAILGQR
jgi:hypothetical protein